MLAVKCGKGIGEDGYHLLMCKTGGGRIGPAKHWLDLERLPNTVKDDASQRTKKLIATPLVMINQTSLHSTFNLATISNLTFPWPINGHNTSSLWQQWKMVQLRV